jgi:hypothetical protein
VSEFSWLFWVLILTLYTESWARAWALHNRDTEARSSGGSHLSE